MTVTQTAAQATEHTCPPWATECRVLGDGARAHIRRPRNGADAEIYHVPSDDGAPHIYLGQAGSDKDYTVEEAAALGSALLELGQAVKSPPIAHPVWCGEVDGEGAPRGEGWAFIAPAEGDRETHRGRTYHVESGDVTLAFGLIQPYEIAPWDGSMHVSPACIDFTMTDHASVDADAGTWLSPRNGEGPPIATRQSDRRVGVSRLAPDDD